MRQIDSVLHDMLFRLEIRVGIENGIGNEQGTRVGGNPFNKDMAHAPGGREANAGSQRSMHKLTGVQATLHHCIDFTCAGECYSLLGGRMTVLSYHNPVGR